MKDPYGREITGLRLSVTSRCDMRCIYCHKEGQTSGQIMGSKSLRVLESGSHEIVDCRLEIVESRFPSPDSRFSILGSRFPNSEPRIPSRESQNSKNEMTVLEIERILKVAKELGITRLKITGGEPLLREDIVEIVCAAAKQMEHVSLTTNGARLAPLASNLKKAGLEQVNISMDTLDRKKYQEMTGTDQLEQVLCGIQAAVAVGFSPIKLNVVVMRGYNENEIEKMIKFAAHTGTILQLIELEDIGNHEFYEKHHSDLTPIESWLERRAGKIEERKLHKRKIYYIPNPVEVVRPMHNTQFCANCTRIRITADGKLKPCLMTQEGYVDIVGLIRQGADDSKLKEAFEKAIMAREPYWK